MLYTVPLSGYMQGGWQDELSCRLGHAFSLLLQARGNSTEWSEQADCPKTCLSTTGLFNENKRHIAVPHHSQQGLGLRWKAALCPWARLQATGLTHKARSNMDSPVLSLCHVGLKQCSWGSYSSTHGSTACKWGICCRQGKARHLIVQAGPRRVNQEDLYTWALLLQECRNACDGASSAGAANKAM